MWCGVGSGPRSALMISCVRVRVDLDREQTEDRRQREREGWDPLGPGLVGPGKFCIFYQ